MNLTTAEIRDLIKVARKYPDMDAEDIISAIVEGYKIKPGLTTLFLNISSLFMERKPTQRPSTSEILEKVCFYYKLPVTIVASKSRKSKLTRARQQYCLIAILFKYSQESVADEINRDHATAFVAKSKAINYTITETEYKHEIDHFINLFPKYKYQLIERLELLIRNSYLQ